MTDVIIRPSIGQIADAGKPWEMQIRRHDCCGPTEYDHIAYLTEAEALAVEGKKITPLFDGPLAVALGKTRNS